jgi:hypothetical protein
MVVSEESADFMDIEIKRKEYGFENVEQHV